jgi:hypothetical protein
MKNKHLHWFLLIGAILALYSLACNYQFSKDQDSESTPAITPTPLPDDAHIKTASEIEAAFAAEVVDDRPIVLEYLGRPDAFDISILTVENTQVRMESWRYYQFGTRIDFVDGEAAWTMQIDPAPEEAIFAAWYDPMAFRGGMTADEVVQVIVSASPAHTKPETIDLAPGGEDLEGGVFLVGDQILVGMENDQLVYVETMGLFPVEGEQ